MFQPRIERLVLLAMLLSCSGRVADRVVSERSPNDSSAGADDGGTSAGAAAGAGGTSIGDSGRAGMGASGNGGTGGVIVEPPQCGEGTYPTPLLPLSSWEYRRTVSALTGADVTVEMPADPTSGGPFAFAMDLNTPTVSLLFDEAELQGTKSRGVKFVQCDPAVSITPECVEKFVDSFVGGAFRRPLTAAERSSYVGLFKLGVGNDDFAGGVELLVEAVLISPHFVFKTNFGAGSVNGNTSALTSFEIASRLSYLLTGAPPDAELRAVAAMGDLSPTTLAAQAHRLQKSPMFSDSMRHFHAQWLGLDALPSLQSAELSSELLASMRTETEHFIEDVFQSKRNFNELLQSHNGFVDDLLAPRYGVPAPPVAFARVALDSTRYFGLLTQASVLTLYNNPTQRGLFVRERLLCNMVPPPPNIPTQITIQPNQTRREAWEQHREDPACAGCHRLTDEIGFGFENFDEVGRFRVTDNGLPVDASGELVATDEVDGPFVGVGELAARLAGSNTVGRCMTKTWLSYALQRAVTDSDACAVERAYDEFALSQLDLGELFVAIAQSDPFRYRDAYRLPNVPAPGMTGGAITPLPARRKTLLDFAIAEASWLAQTAPETERPLVELYMTSLRELEQKLSQLGPVGPGPTP